MNIAHFRRHLVNLCLAFLLLCLTVGSAPAYAVSAEPQSAPAPAAGVALPRAETLYFNGLQWGAVNCWNPYSSGCNNSLVLNQQDNARVTVWETPYVYNMLDGKVYPLLAEGDFAWDAGMTQITFTLKSAAHWSDGTAVTAEDVAYTWATNVLYGTDMGNQYKDVIATIEAPDAQTVVVKAVLGGDNRASNPLLVAAYLSTGYVIQKTWTQTLEARAGYDAGVLKSDPADDFVASGPYRKYFADNTIVALVRDDSYWGQDASMWGKLPTPKYLAHVIYEDEDAGLAALKAGQVDISQQFIANVQDLWLVDHLPVSTYYPDAPYDVGASLPTMFYNLSSYGLDQVAVRKAIAVAVNYDQIISEALTNQSATFTQVPRSLMNPSPAEQAMYDSSDPAVKDLQWMGNDITSAQKLLDDAGIVDNNGDGWREYNGKTLYYTVTCPNGWTDWQAAVEIVASAMRSIGIFAQPIYPEWSDYQQVFTNGDQSLFDLFMGWTDGAGPTQPWGRARRLMSSEYAGTMGNWNGNWGGYSNPAADTLLQAIPAETDPAALKAAYTELTKIYLTDVPSFTLMYRPQSFHTVYEGLWKGFPKSGDGVNPPVPPLDLIDGYSIAGLYNLVSTAATATLRSTAAQDGWVLESAEGSNQGGSLNAADPAFRLGDDTAKKQYVGVLSFGTGAALPDDAVITKVTLKVKRQGVTGGGDPVNLFQGFLVDVKKGTFGTAALQVADFQASLGTTGRTYGPFKPALSGGWYSIDLTAGSAYINKSATGSGLTQIRLHFKLDDNGNTIANYLSLYSGNAPAVSQPQLVIEYYVP